MAKTKKTTGTKQTDVTKRRRSGAGADNAPALPAALTAVGDGAGPLELSEVIDRLYEVVAEDCPASRYGFEDLAAAERVLDRSMGPEGKTALARARAARPPRAEEQPPSSPRREATLADEARADAPATPPELDFAGPDLGDEPSPLAGQPAPLTEDETPVTVDAQSDPAVGGPLVADEEQPAPLTEEEGFFAEHLRALCGPGTLPPKPVRKRLLSAGLMGRVGAGAATHYVVTDAGRALAARAPEPAPEGPPPGDSSLPESTAPGHHDEEDHGGTPHDEDPVRNGDEPGPVSAPPGTTLKSVRRAALRGMGTDELMALHVEVKGKPSKLKTRPELVYYILKYETAKGLIHDDEEGTKPARASAPPRSSGSRAARVARHADPRAAAAAKFSAAVCAANDAFTADLAAISVDFDSGSRSPAAAVGAHLADLAVLAAAYVLAAAPPPAAAPGPASPAPPVVKRAAVKQGEFADIGTKFASTYVDALAADQMKGLKVNSVVRGHASCVTPNGEVVRLLHAHLVPAAGAPAPAA